jgi:hypothetical protein
LSDKSTTNTTTLNNEFNLIRDSFEIAFRKRTLLNEQVKYVNNMPANSEAWVTEWNIMFDWDKIKKVGNTLLHSMFYTDQILSYFDMNANVNLVTSCNKSNPIQICNYHVSYAGNDNDTWYPMMRFPSGYNSTYIDYKTTTNSNPNDIRYQSTFYAQQLLSPIINDTSIKYINNINGGFTVLQNCLFRTFFRENDAGCFGCSNSDLYIYFNNKSSNNYSIAIQTALSNFLGTTYCISSAKKNYLYANNLFCVHG